MKQPQYQSEEVTSIISTQETFISEWKSEADASDCLKDMFYV